MDPLALQQGRGGDEDAGKDAGVAEHQAHRGRPIGARNYTKAENRGPDLSGWPYFIYC